MTTLTITPNLAKKTAKFVGAVAAGEHVEVTLKFCASITDTSSLRLRVVGPCGTLAIFPQPESEDAWEVDGEDLKCVLNLNTIQMLKALAPAIEAELLVVLDDAENHVLYFKDTCAFKHWPMRRGDDTPYDLDEFPGLIEEWREEIDNISASVEKVGTVATISITDKDGTTTTAKVRDGEDGEDGEDGTDGVGIPAGGTTGQILVKASATDYDTEWRTAGGSGGEQANWNETDPISPAYIKNKPTSFPPSAHKDSHKTGGSDAISPSDIGAIPTTSAGVANGVATLDENGMLDQSQMPELPKIPEPINPADAEKVGEYADALATKNALAGKAPTASPWFTNTVGIAGVGGSDGANLTAQNGRLINNGVMLAEIGDVYYAANESPSVMDATDRVVTRYKVVSGTPLTITLPEISADRKYIANLDLCIDAIGVTTLPAITIQPATGGKLYAPDGTMPEIKPDCITIIDATSVPGMNAWAILGASELKEVTNA